MMNDEMSIRQSQFINVLISEKGNNRN